MSQNEAPKRPLELTIAVIDGGTTEAEAHERGASAADAALVILRRDRPEEKPEYVVTSTDATGAPLGVEEVFRVWVALASSILHTDDNAPAAHARRRFCKWTLERLGIDENLQRLTRLRGEHPELSAQEIVQRMREEDGGDVST